MDREPVTHRTDRVDEKKDQLTWISIPSFGTVLFNTAEPLAGDWKVDIQVEPIIAPDEIHIWMIPLSVDPTICSAELCLLSDDEAMRANRFRFDRDRSHYVMAHAAMRRVLGRYLRRSPESLEFRLSAFGKPDVVAAPGARQLQFSLSRSRSRSLLAISDDVPLGVDCEYVQEDFPVLSVAQQFFTKNEVLQLQRKSGKDQVKAFYRCWTRKEALVKAFGAGLSCPLDVFSVDVDTLEAQMPCNEGNPFQTLNEWTIVNIPMQDGYVGALAVAASEHG
jgi:4'-phosphopantetheinyl transferase